MPVPMAVLHAMLPFYARLLALLKRLLGDGGRAESWGPYMINQPTSYRGTVLNRGKLILPRAYFDQLS